MKHAALLLLALMLTLLAPAQDGGWRISQHKGVPYVDFEELRGFYKFIPSSGPEKGWY